MAFPRRLLVDGEELVLDLRPHWIALVPPGLVTLAVALAWIVLLPRVPGEGTVRSAVLWLILGAGLLVLLSYPVRQVVAWATSHFVVTSDRVIHREGLIAKRSMEVPLEAINDVRFQQTVFERMIGAGDLIIQSASEAGRQVFSDIRDPEDVQKTIYHMGELNQRRMASGPGPAAPSVTTELERLADLRARGVLTEDEFQAQKARILRGR
jgi:uncharacterized membrane protein YdbT with pleckstrin-like domain